MGSDLKPDPEEVISYTELFRRVEPWYLSLGMPLDEFWNGPPERAKVYREAAKIRERHENNVAWRNGMYFMSAINATIMNAFRKKGTSPADYLKEPLPLSKEEVEQRKLRDQELAEQRIIDMLNRRATAGTVSKK